MNSFSELNKLGTLIFNFKDIATREEKLKLKEYLSFELNILEFELNI